MKIINTHELDKIDEVGHFAIRLTHLEYINTTFMKKLTEKVKDFKCVGDSCLSHQTGEVFPSHMLTFSKIR